MKLRSRLYLFSCVAILSTTMYMLFAGVAIIDQVVFQMNKRILELELERIVGIIDDYHKVLEDSGLAGLENYRKALEGELTSKFKDFKFGRTGSLYMTTPTGSSLFKEAGSSLVWPASERQRPEGSFEFKTPVSQIPEFCVFKTTRNGWKVAIYMERSEIFEKRSLYFKVVLLVGAIVLCLALGASYYFAKRLSDQIDKILDILRRVAKGDLYARISIDPFCDEHRGLQDGINSMIDNLRIRDIERERAEEEARKHQKLESIGILAGGIAHDFNNLLTAIRGNLQLAQMLSDSNSDAKQCLADCEKATVRAMDLTKQLLTFSKGGMPIKAIASISELIENNATFVLRGTKSKCEFDFAEDLHPVNVDSSQIGQAIDNIVINANQAMPEGGIIRVRAENVNIADKTPLPLAPGSYVKISIADSGSGIPKANLSKIFDPYFTTKPSGSGLGLSTTYTILKKHGGHIAVDSEPGVGTIFFLYLPASPLGEIGARSSEEDGKYSGGGKILLMDDQESIRNLLSKMLSIMNCECDFAEDGAAAIDKFVSARSAGAPFDMIFMDLTIPGGMGGKDAIEIIRKIDPEAIAVVASGYSNDPVMANYQDYGFKGRLDKPFKMQDLARLMNSLMKGRRPVKGRRSGDTAKSLPKTVAPSPSVKP